MFVSLRRNKRTNRRDSRWHLRGERMHVLVNGVRLFFDVEGAKLVPDGPVMREKPTLLMLHGGPGFDHSSYKPAYSALADVAQVIYLDHRGNGRSNAGPREAWTLAQWGDDMRAFCDVLGIEKPIVLGVSFGGMVALAYATRHPDHMSMLIVISTEAKGDTHLERRVAMFETPRRPRSRRVGSPSFPGGEGPDRSSRARRVAPAGNAAIHAHCAPSRRRTALDQPA
jgi:pimeloyl-ACP methyl ester carboxylesterase